jgi:hypothetical protein
MNLLLFCMASIGLTDIIVDSRIRTIVLESRWYQPIRNFCSHFLPTAFYEMFDCHQCAGTWIGFLLGYILLGHSIGVVLASGFAASFLANAYEVIHTCMDVWYMNNMHTEIDDE